MASNHRLGFSQTVLVVDDDRDILTVMTEVLTLAGYRVKAAMSGREGLRLALEERPDLILLDVILADMSGTEFAAAYRERTPPAGRAAVIITTAHADAARIAGESRADGLLAKPFDIDELVKCVRQTLGRRPRAA